jgi:hypothetical protein
MSRDPLFTAAQLKAIGRQLNLTEEQRRPHGGIFGPMSPGETLAPLFTAEQLDAREAELKRFTEGLGT